MGRSQLDRKHKMLAAYCWSWLAVRSWGPILSTAYTHAMLAALRQHGCSLNQVPWKVETPCGSWVFQHSRKYSYPPPPPHTHTHTEGLLVSISNSSGNSSFCSYFLLQIFSFDTLPLGIYNNPLYYGGKRYFLQPAKGATSWNKNTNSGFFWIIFNEL